MSDMTRWTGRHEGRPSAQTMPDASRRGLGSPPRPQASKALSRPAQPLDHKPGPEVVAIGLDLLLLASSTAPAQIRTLVGFRLADWRLRGITYDVQLIASELVTNAIKSTPNAEIRVRLTRERNTVLLGVWDSSNAMPISNASAEASQADTAPDHRTPDAGHHADTHGRGLPIVEALWTRHHTLVPGSALRRGPRQGVSVRQALPGRRPSSPSPRCCGCSHSGPTATPASPSASTPFPVAAGDTTKPDAAGRATSLPAATPSTPPIRSTRSSSTACSPPPGEPTRRLHMKGVPLERESPRQPA